MIEDLPRPVLVPDFDPAEADFGEEGINESEIDADEDLTCPGSVSLTKVRVRRPQSTRLAKSPGEPDDIFAFWERLRGKRAFPARSELDDKTVAFYWPYSVIFRVAENGDRIEVDTAINPTSSIKAGWLRAGGDGGKLQFVITEWLMPLVRTAALRGIPIDETTLLPLGGKAVRYRGISLPFSEDGVGVDFVLAHIVVLDERLAR